MRLALLLVLASLTAGAAEPMPCYDEELAVGAARVSVAVSKKRAEATAGGTTEERYAVHMEVVAAQQQLDVATKVLTKCRAGKAVKP